MHGRPAKGAAGTGTCLGWRALQMMRTRMQMLQMNQLWHPLRHCLEIMQAE